MRIPDRGCGDALTENSVVAGVGNDRNRNGSRSGDRQAVRLVPCDVGSDMRVAPKEAPNLNEGLADILDWYIHMAGTAGSSRLSSKE